MGGPNPALKPNADLWKHLTRQGGGSSNGEVNMCLIDQHIGSHPAGPLPASNSPASDSMDRADAETAKGAFKKTRTGSSAAKVTQYAFEYGLALQTVRDHARSQQVLKTMAKAIRKYENIVKNTQGPKGAKAAKELASLREAYKAAEAAYNEQKVAVRAANRFLQEFQKVRSTIARTPVGGLGNKVLNQLKGLAPHAQRLTRAMETTKVGRAGLRLGRVVAHPAFKKGVTVLAAVSEGVISYIDSPAATQGGKVANSVTGAAAGVLPMLSVPVALVDVVAPTGYKPTEHFRGTAASITVIGEALITGESGIRQLSQEVPERRLRCCHAGIK